ncbi:hypothetical protein WICPIJ_001282, partial [Wickerhamomyces pijperi]
NNCLTEINSFDAPNLQAHIKSLQLQVQEINNYRMDEATLREQDPGFLDKVQILKEFKESEIKYLQSYLNVLNLINSIEEQCDACGANNDDYDYDKEDEILAKVEIEMTKFHQYETELSHSKQHWEIVNLENVTKDSNEMDRSLLRNHRNNSMSKFEQTLIEDIHQPHLRC